MNHSLIVCKSIGFSSAMPKLAMLACGRFFSGRCLFLAEVGSSRMLSAGILLLVASVCTIAQESAIAQERDYREEWQEFLTTVAELEDASLFIDVDPRRKPPHPRFEEPRGMETIERLATLMNRSFEEVEGTYVLYRWIGPEDLRARSDHALALSWLQGLSDVERKALLSSSGLSFDQVLGQGRTVLTHVIRKLSGGIGDRMLADHPSEVRIAVGFTPFILFNDPETGRPVRLSILQRYPRLDPLPEHTSVSDNERSAIEPISRPRDGQLDFGDGEVLTLAELFKKGLEEWNLRFWYDGRLADTVYFVSGRFDKKRFMDCIELATRTVETKEGRDEFQALSDSVVNDLIRAFFDDPSANAEGTQLSVGDFSSGRMATLSEILGPNADPSVLSAIERYGLSMDQRFELMPGLVLAFKAPGMSRIEDAPDGWPQHVSHSFGLSFRGN